MKPIRLIGQLLLVLFFISAGVVADEPKAILLWAKGAPGSEGKTGDEIIKTTGNGERIVSGIHNPSITPYLPLPAKATGASIIIAPGGGHYQLSIDSEGNNLGRWFSEHGIAVFVLKYRLAREPGSTYSVEGNALTDMQRAVRMVRSRAKEWGLDTARIGVLGFSAGGELAGLAAMRSDNGLEKAIDDIDKQSSKPAFQALIYPGSSGKFIVSKNSPPAFIVCGYNDRPDISRGMAELYLKFKDANVPADLHIYAKSGHGFGYRESDQKAEAGWPARLEEWMKDMGFLKKNL